MGIATTVWYPSSGNGEYSYISIDDIADPTDSSILIADPTGTLLISPTVTYSPVPLTIWSGDNSI